MLSVAPCEGHARALFTARRTLDFVGIVFQLHSNVSAEKIAKPGVPYAEEQIGPQSCIFPTAVLD